MVSTHFVTGATGYLGAHFVYELLKGVPDASVVCFARSTSMSIAADRVIDAIRMAALVSGALLSEPELARVLVIEADPLTEDPRRITESLGRMPGPDVFWHMAASVSFVDTDDGLLRRTNVDGTKNALDIATALGCGEFNYISTAFVCGKREGDIEESLSHDVPQFCNSYEESKYEAEHLVDRLCRDRGIPLRIFRPSIVVGHSRTFLSSSDSGLYKYTEILAEYCLSLQRKGVYRSGEAIRISAPASSTLNFVPVDFCVREMIEISRTDASLGGIYHLVSKNAFRGCEYCAVFSDLTGIKIEAVDPDDSSSTLTRRDINLSRRIARYAPYTAANKVFSRASVLKHVACDMQESWELDARCIRMWLTQYLKKNRLLRNIAPEASLFCEQKGFGQDFNVAGCLVRHVRSGRYTGVALRHRDGEVSYRSLCGKINAVARFLSDHGVHYGVRVALAVPDGEEAVEAILATWFVGAVTVHLNVQSTDAELLRGLSQSGALLLVADAKTLQRLGEGGWTGSNLSLDMLREIGEDKDAPRVDWLPAITSPYDQAFGVFTSGSTGRPKLVIHRHLSPVVAVDRYAAQLLDINKSDVVFSASRLSFAFGLQNLLLALLNGATAVTAPATVNPESVVETIVQLRPTILFAVPTVYQLILADPILSASAKENALRMAISAGEKLPEKIRSSWHELTGRSICESLGSSEAFSTYLSNEAGVCRPGATGKLIPGFDALLIDEAGAPAAKGEPGVLWIRGPSVISEYGCMPEAPAGIFKDGWFCTSDVFLRDSDGYFYYQGRVGEMFKVGGQWISPSELEGAILEHPKVASVAVTSFHEDAATLVPIAYVVSSAPADRALADELKQLCKRRLGHWKYPRIVQFVDTLPRSGNGKLLRREIGAWARSAKKTGDAEIIHA